MEGRFMKRFLLTALISSLCLTVSPANAEARYQAAPPTASSQEVPPLVERFPGVNPNKYRVPVYKGRFARDIADKHHGYRTRLRQALKGGEVNFGGHYILMMPGCGTACLNPMVLDVKTGKIYDVALAPFTGIMSQGDNPVWSDMDFHYSPDSTLLYFSGAMGEDGDSGSFALAFKNGVFQVVGYSKVVKYNQE